MIASIDAGSAAVKVLAGRRSANPGIEIIGRGYAPNTGAPRGKVTDLPRVLDAVVRAVTEAEKAAGARIESAVAGVGDLGCKSFSVTKTETLGTVSRVVNRADIDKLHTSFQSTQLPSNMSLLHIVQTGFWVDKGPRLRNPAGQTGKVLHGAAQIVAVPSNIRDDLVNCLRRAGVGSVELVFEPLAVSSAVLTDDEKELGVAVVDVGAGSTGMAVWLEGAPRYLAVMRLSASHFTKDLSEVLRLSVASAEKLKVEEGTLNNIEDASQMVTVVTASNAAVTVSRQLTSKILRARSYDLIEDFVWQALTSVVSPGEIRAGIVMTGGGALLDGLVPLAEKRLGIGVRLGSPEGFSGCALTPEWSCAAGLLCYAVEASNPARKDAGLVSGFLRSLTRIPGLLKKIS